jgi:hypothetical protein
VQLNPAQNDTLNADSSRLEVHRLATQVQQLHSQLQQLELLISNSPISRLASPSLALPANLTPSSLAPPVSSRTLPTESVQGNVIEAEIQKQKKLHDIEVMCQMQPGSLVQST